jgi:hypothetical protein
MTTAGEMAANRNPRVAAYPQGRFSSGFDTRVTTSASAVAGAKASRDAAHL